MGTNYNNLYADIYTWCSSSGYLDYIAPQIYWGFNYSNPTYAFVKCSNDWNNIVTNSSVKMVIGLAAYKLGDTSYPDFCNQERILARQIEHARTLSRYSGVAMFSYRSLFTPSAAVKTVVDAEVQAITTELNK